MVMKIGRLRLMADIIRMENSPDVDLELVFSLCRQGVAEVCGPMEWRWTDHLSQLSEERLEIISNILNNSKLNKKN